MIYINPKKQFLGETRDIIKIQIDNSLDLGWNPEDIVLATNFPYEYNGIKAIEVDDSHFRDFDTKSGKISVIIHLIASGVVRSGELWWFHDLDAYQLLPIEENEIDLGGKGVGFTYYGWKEYWNTGSIFFTKDALKVFSWMRNVFDQKKINEEPALMWLTKKNYKNINDLYQIMNNTYNFPASRSGEKYLEITTKNASMPIKVLHFGPLVLDGVNYLWVNRGHNRMGLYLITDRLLKIFRKHIPELCQNL